MAIVATYPVRPDDSADRNVQRDASVIEADRLYEETGREHHMRWNKVDHQYEVIETPFRELSKPWDAKDNPPPTKHNDFDKRPSMFCPCSDLLIRARDIVPSQWLVANDRPHDPAAFVKDLQIALDLQYQRGRFWANRHGSRIAVQCHFGVPDDLQS
jgi:hypothetical protein